MTTTALSPQRYFDLIDIDTERLLAMGERGLDPAVPRCEGWTVRDVITHTAEVYQHKIRVMADNTWPDPWPPSDFESREPLEFLRQSKADLFGEFAEHEPTEETTTFSPSDSTITFWIRRMALEVAVHRYDAELAHRDTTPIPDDESLDGIDELLRVMLEADESENISTEFPIDGLVAVESGGRRWLCDVREKSVTISDDASTPALAT
ncbi:MAG: maleylpyruvate isomerase family mycothiol-dependent enzyme, partial [Nocardioidaceae bacterium]